MTGLQFGTVGLALMALMAQLMSATVLAETTFTPIRGQVVVTEVTGTTEYSYESTGWKALTRGKILQAGASVRAARKSNVVLKAVDGPTLIKVTAGTQVHLTLEREE